MKVYFRSLDYLLIIINRLTFKNFIYNEKICIIVDSYVTVSKSALNDLNIVRKL